jgi:hypothetical protein
MLPEVTPPPLPAKLLPVAPPLPLLALPLEMELSAPPQSSIGKAPKAHKRIGAKCWERSRIATPEAGSTPTRKPLNFAGFPVAPT